MLSKGEQQIRHAFLFVRSALFGYLLRFSLTTRPFQSKWIMIHTTLMYRLNNFLQCTSRSNTNYYIKVAFPFLRLILVTNIKYRTLEILLSWLLSLPYWLQCNVGLCPNSDLDWFLLSWFWYILMEILAMQNIFTHEDIQENDYHSFSRLWICSKQRQPIVHLGFC